MAYNRARYRNGATSAVHLYTMKRTNTTEAIKPNINFKTVWDVLRTAITVIVGATTIYNGVKNQLSQQEEALHQINARIEQQNGQLEVAKENCKSLELRLVRLEAIGNRQ